MHVIYMQVYIFNYAAMQLSKALTYKDRSTKRVSSSSIATKCKESLYCQLAMVFHKISIKAYLFSRQSLLFEYMHFNSTSIVQPLVYWVTSTPSPVSANGLHISYIFSIRNIL